MKRRNNFPAHMLVDAGETGTIARNGKPIADLVPAHQVGLPLGIAADDPVVPLGDDWWKPMSHEEAEAWIEGR